MVRLSTPAIRARLEAVSETLRGQWRPVVVPGLFVWALATVVSVTLLHPGDVTEYSTYAHAALTAPLLHRLPSEYPAPALVIFLLPLLIPLAYPWAFAVLAGIGLLALITSYQGASITGWDVASSRRLVAYLALGSVMVVAGRYDIFATAAALFSLRAAKGGRWSAAWTWSTVGFALKLFPAVFWPAFFIAEWRKDGRLPIKRLVWVAGGLVVIAAAPALFDPGALLNVAHFYVHRPTEVGSLAAGLSLLLDWRSTRWINTSHSLNVFNSVAAPISTVVVIAAVIACVALWRVQLRGRLPLEAVCLATLTLAVVGGKVLSVQYLIWLMPLWALYRVRASWVAACVINLAIYPYASTAERVGYPSHAVDVTITLAFLARDVLVAVGTGTWLWSLRSAGAAADSGSLGPVAVDLPEEKAVLEIRR